MTTVQTESLGVLSVSPQGGYLAKSCPEAVQLDVLRPVEPLPTSQFMTMLAARRKDVRAHGLRLIAVFRRGSGRSGSQQGAGPP